MNNVYAYRCIHTLSLIIINLLTSEGQKPVLGSILITEQVKTQHSFSLRMEACARFDPNHQTGGNPTFIFSKDESLCSVRS